MRTPIEQSRALRPRSLVLGLLVLTHPAAATRCPEPTWTVKRISVELIEGTPDTGAGYGLLFEEASWNVSAELAQLTSNDGLWLVNLYASHSWIELDPVSE